MQTELILIRDAQAEDATALAALHAASWRYAYRGVLPALALERMIARHGPDWWARLARGVPPPLVLCFDGRIAGYAQIGRNRSGATGGEIYELYLAPEFHGLGFGRRLFEAARAALRAHGLEGLTVWALDENAIARRFYEALGGEPAGRGETWYGGKRIATVGFHWR